MTLRERVTAAFAEHFGTPPDLLVRAPGRVNLIGEHTDYNDGFVLPMAIDRAVWIALRPRTDDVINLVSLDFEAPITFNLSDFERGPSSPAEYVKGVAWALRDAGIALHGLDGVMKGDVPIGAGLSSSAALELATARALTALAGVEWQPAHMARLSQRAENAWVGVNCGIMDQMISAAGESGHALLIDCRTLETEPVPLPPQTSVLVLDTGTRRGLVDSAYNERRQQCETAAAFFGVPALRDVTPELFAQRADDLDLLTRQRARHVVTENARVLEARAAMFAGDAQALGRLMAASHRSLRDDYEVSSPALDTMVEITSAQPGVYGARMTGAGFGGCAVALVAADRVGEIVPAVEAAYRQQTQQSPSIYVCQPAAGASVEVMSAL